MRKFSLMFLVMLAALLVQTSAIAQDTEYNEAPMLTELVDAGELPPVADRLPSNPRVITPYEEIGEYGGTWRRAFRGAADDRGPQKLMWERPVRYYQDPATNSVEIVPSWVSSIEGNEDASEFTFTIRDGLRWSDGEPVTVDDVRFWYEDVISNEDLTSVFPSLLSVNGERMIIEYPDDLTFVVQFAAPNPLFLAQAGRQYWSFALPEHYLRNFHADYTDADSLAAAVEENEVDNWTDLWGRRGKIESFWLNPDVPVLNAWQIVTPPPADVVVFERNPYYFAVDTEGNQLPYIDRIEHTLFQDQETFNLFIVQGQIDLQGRHVNVGDFTLYAENAEAGDYSIVQWRNANTETLWPNQTVDDPVIAELFADIRFREAMNVAIDREVINELVYAGLAEARQASPISGSQFYDAEFETKWAEYDPERANALLDEIGLTEFNGDGLRLRPDGDPLVIRIDTPLFQTTIDSLELVSAFWQEVGIGTNINVMDRSLYLDRANANDIMMGHWGWGRDYFVASPGRWLGTINDGSFGLAYGNFFSGREPAIEPPADHPIYDVWNAWERVSTATTFEEALEHAQEMVSIHRENVLAVGLVGEDPKLYIKSNRVGNFPAGLIDDDVLRQIGLAAPMQFFIRSEQ